VTDFGLDNRLGGVNRWQMRFIDLSGLMRVVPFFNIYVFIFSASMGNLVKDGSYVTAIEETW